MLLQEKMESTDFSPNEKIVVDFIMNKQENIENYSTTMIAKETYTSPSVLVRIAKKLNFDGWTKLKKAYVEEITYLHKHFKEIDANTPFTKTDSIREIVNKLAQLKSESIQDTLSLLDYDALQQAIDIINSHQVVRLFGLSNIVFQAEEFVFKMRHIGKGAESFEVQGMMFQESAMTTSKDCAIIISYSGESGELITDASFLKKNHVPIIAITSIGDNTLSQMADITLYVTTRERSYSKIAGFSSLESISLILDILYSGCFASNYDDHYNYKVDLSKATEFRPINNEIIQEN
ncbi:MurR/RpiR family transcriptional regulator [Companilactobacillus hulinensis]|uniref:MurR/RpiR family transcriptional regulator n=1 Tax=Companilactobacillus hulinensis TaxID=2486007 RepID=UPI000F786FC9|nr:MurR/RpiR family transcriptional regulator [Companilactobacillus hulinensis]